MKKILLLLTCCSLLSGCSLLFPPDPMSFRYSIYLDGYWGKWSDFYTATYQGSPQKFTVYNPYGHPSQFYFRVTITDTFNEYAIPDSFVSFKGYIEYREIDYHLGRTPTIKEFSRNFVTSPSTFNSGKIIKRSATISISRTPKRGYVYNIFFDDVGLGLTIPWKAAF